MLSDYSPEGHHEEESVKLVCVVSERWKVTGKACSGSNSECISYGSRPKMSLAVSRASEVLVVSLGTQTEIKMTSCQNVIDRTLSSEFKPRCQVLCQGVTEGQ